MTQQGPDADQPAGEFRREHDRDELLVEGERQQFPPTHYDR